MSWRIKTYNLLINDLVYKQLGWFIKNNEKILEVGLGTGLHLKSLYEDYKHNNCEILSIETDEEYIKEAYKNLKDYNIIVAKHNFVDLQNEEIKTYTTVIFNYKLSLDETFWDKIKDLILQGYQGKFIFIQTTCTNKSTSKVLSIFQSSMHYLTKLPMSNVIYEEDILSLFNKIIEETKDVIKYSLYIKPVNTIHLGIQTKIYCLQC
jgi:tRNA A58 N-methylase Trm61